MRFELVVKSDEGREEVFSRSLIPPSSWRSSLDRAGGPRWTPGRDATLRWNSSTKRRDPVGEILWMAAWAEPRLVAPGDGSEQSEVAEERASL